MKKQKKTKNNITVFLRKFTRNRNIFVFLFFLLLSTFLWFLNALNKEYTTIAKIGFKIENIPESLSLRENTGNQLEIDIYGHGYSLLKAKMERTKLPLIIDLNNKNVSGIIHKNSINPDEAYILTSDLYYTLSKRFSDNVQITGIHPDTIYFHSNERKYSKKVPITPDIKYSIHQDYIQNGKPQLSQDSVIIYGRQEILDTITQVFTKKNDLGILEENSSKVLELITYPNINYSLKNIIIRFPIEKYTETFKEINIQILNFPENTNVILDPGIVQIYYKVPLSLYNQIEENNFEASVNYDKKKNDIISIDINSKNNVIEITKINPVFVKYFLEKNNSND